MCDKIKIFAMLDRHRKKDPLPLNTPRHATLRPTSLRGLGKKIAKFLHVHLVTSSPSDQTAGVDESASMQTLSEVHYIGFRTTIPAQFIYELPARAISRLSLPQDFVQRLEQLKTEMDMLQVQFTQWVDENNAHRGNEGGQETNGATDGQRDDDSLGDLLMHQRTNSFTIQHFDKNIFVDGDKGICYSAHQKRRMGCIDGKIVQWAHDGGKELVSNVHLRHDSLTGVVDSGLDLQVRHFREQRGMEKKLRWEVGLMARRDEDHDDEDHDNEDHDDDEDYGHEEGDYEVEDDCYNNGDGRYNDDENTLVGSDYYAEPEEEYERGFSEDVSVIESLHENHIDWIQGTNNGHFDGGFEYAGGDDGADPVRQIVPELVNDEEPDNNTLMGLDDHAEPEEEYFDGGLEYAADNFDANPYREIAAALRSDGESSEGEPFDEDSDEDSDDDDADEDSDDDDADEETDHDDTDSVPKQSPREDRPAASTGWRCTCM